MKRILFLFILILGLRVLYFSAQSNAVLSRCSEGLEEEHLVKLSGVLEQESAFHWKIGDWKILGQKSLREYRGFPVEVWGRSRCVLEPQNPARLSSLPGLYEEPKFILSLKKIRVLDPVPQLSQRDRFNDWLTRKFAAFPNLLSLERALWFGDLSGFSKAVRETYLFTGSLAVLALSGQHVAGLFVLVESFLSVWVLLVLRWVEPKRRKKILDFYLPVKLFLPVLVSLVLLYMSRYSPSMVRTTAMVSCVFLVRILGIGTSLAQVLSTSAGLLLLWNPLWILNPGFILSLTSTYFLVSMGEKTGKMWLGHYLLFSFSFCLLMQPWMSYYFSKTALLAFPVQIVLGILWDFCIVPIGFALPFLGGGYFFLEEIWVSFLNAHQKWAPFLEKGYLTTIRVNDAELFLLECCLFACVRHWFLRGANFHFLWREKH